MSDLLERVKARALLYAAPDTEVSVEEFATAMGRCVDWCRVRRPKCARIPDGGRAIMAPFKAWLEATGYREPVVMPQQPRPTGNHPHWLYLAAQSDQYKIGVADDPVGRAQTLCTGTGRPTVLVAVLGTLSRADAEYEEKLAFGALADYRRLGEWFDRVAPVPLYFQGLQGVEFLQ